MFTYQITVYNKNQKLGLLDCFSDWAGNDEYILVISHTKNSITYQLNYHSRAHLNRAVQQYFQNLKNGLYN